MVKKIILILCILTSFMSCDILLRTPFPEELTYWKDSVFIDGIGPNDSVKLYSLDSYVFLIIQRMENNNKLYIFTEDLNPIYSTDIWFHTDTFAMKDAASYYFIGSERYEIAGDNVILRGNPFDGLSVEGDTPPYGFGFSHDGVNYRVWWDYGNKTLKHMPHDLNWGTIIADPYEITLTDYNEIMALYYHENPKYAEESVVIIFFRAENYSDIEIATIPASYFNDSLGLHYDFPEYFNTIVIEKLDVKECYYTGDGYIIKEHNGTYRYFDREGNLKAEMDTDENENEYPEAYSMNGKSRYIFSEQYSRLMKTGPWW